MGDRQSIQKRFPWRKDEVAQYFSLPRERRTDDQRQRLVAMYRFAWDHIPFYRALWEADGLTVDSVSSLDDLRKLPTNSIHDIRASIAEHPPFGDYHDTQDLRDIAFITGTGGTTGASRPVFLTPSDIDAVVDIAARCLAWVGVGPKDLLNITASFGIHGAAWVAAWAGARCGAALLTPGAGATTPSERQIHLIEQYRPTVMFATASYTQILADTAYRLGIDPARTSIEKIVPVGEVHSPQVRARLMQQWRARVWDLYGTAETLTWSSIDCDVSSDELGVPGMHIWDDAILIEVLDDEGKPCPDGVYGDMTVTSWVLGNMPRFRYRMGDSVAVVRDPCPCGLDTPRMLPLRGRVDDMIRINMLNIWPSAIEEIIRAVAPDAHEWACLAERIGGRDRLRIEVECDRPGGEALCERVKHEIKVRLELGAVDVIPVPAGSTAALTGAGVALKPRRVFDLRSQGS